MRGWRSPTPRRRFGRSVGSCGVGGSAFECECARESVRERVFTRTAAPRRVGAGCHGNAPRLELIISCGKCAGGAERGGQKRRRRGAASRRLVGPGRAPGAAAKLGFRLRQAGESKPRRAGRGLGAGGPPGPLIGTPRPGPPYPQIPLPGPAEGRGEDWALETQPCAVPRRPRHGPARAEDLVQSRAWGGMSPRIRAASGPPFRFHWPGNAGPYRETACPSAPPPPFAEVPRNPGLPKGLQFRGPPTTYVPWAVRFSTRRPRGAGQTQG